MCTTRYMAPEMLSLRNGGSYNATVTDTWGCGACLYSMLLGRPPFPAASFPELVSLASDPDANLYLPELLPKDLRTLIRTMLRLDPKQRHSLLQVAQSPWFQDGLTETLALTPGFVPPTGMRLTRTKIDCPSAMHAQLQQERPAQLEVETFSHSLVLKRCLGLVLGRRAGRSRVASSPPGELEDTGVDGSFTSRMAVRSRVFGRLREVMMYPHATIDLSKPRRRPDEVSRTARAHARAP